MNKGEEYAKKLDEGRKQYDICKWEELLKFNTDSIFSPEMNDVIVKFFKVYL